MLDDSKETLVPLAKNKRAALRAAYCGRKGVQVSPGARDIMAMDNRQRVSESLSILRKGILPFLQRELRLHYKARWWVDGVEPSLLDKERVDARRSGSTDKEWFQSLDTHKLLRVMWDQWNEVFRPKLNQIGRNYVSELREVRNRWAHEKPFSLGETFRAIDTVSRLLRMVASDYAAETDRLAGETLQLLADEESKRAPQRDVAIPRPDVASRGARTMKPAADSKGMAGLLVRASDVLQSGQSAIVVFTDGREFEHTRDGSGQTGYWVMDPRRPFEKVIIYKRDQKSGTNEVWTATPVGIIPAPESFPGRYIIRLSGVKLEGTTDERWFSFAQTGPNPIRYLTKP